MTKEQQLVREFMLACQPDMVADRPQMLSSELHELRIDLIQEELDEYAEAVNYYSVADALCDLLYVVYGAAECHGIDLEPIFEEVHRSNMTKIGGPQREDGKQMKPDTWSPPDIYSQIEMQLA